MNKLKRNVCIEVVLITLILLCLFLREMKLYHNKISGYKHFSSGNISVEMFGAKGDGVTDDTKAINDAYNFARANRMDVYYTSSAYLITSIINGTGVNSFGNMSRLIFKVNPTTGCAFRWGGEGCTVNGLWFDLYNTVQNTAMQGVVNSVNNVKNQNFTNNKINTNTFMSNGDANIYGLWFDSTGIEDLYVANNGIDNCKYGIQINNQSSQDIDVDISPLGNPSKNIIIENNRLMDATIGINTPHIFCSNVIVSKNIVKSKYGLEINLAHVTNYKVIDNICEGDISAIDSNIHIEDVSYNGIISGNELKPSANQDGIRYIVAPGVSKDSRNFNDSSIITNNFITGKGSNSNTSGILVGDIYGNFLKITNNKVSSIKNGIITCGYNNSTSRNNIDNANLALTIIGANTEINDSTFINCFNIIKTTKDVEINNCKIINSYCISPIRDKKSNSKVIYNNINYIKINVNDNTQYDLITLPEGEFNFDIGITAQNETDVILSEFSIKGNKDEVHIERRGNKEGGVDNIVLENYGGKISIHNLNVNKSENIYTTINIKGKLVFY
ncbi:hypothetical protein CPJCM30710_00510 [Clostridium polyendosporum]|uniref:Pectate lyase superfamily protein n=1 Tax=Clostridium polyendosporum TaxID=69208 RepID=A0A919RXR5_9CLOT|nr:hypothetical protein [Clostridium polyendosporum]GIM27385.1 hypothetical protein CPJCM30710_00510 [Clostridium polyendosporum]